MCMNSMHSMEVIAGETFLYIARDNRVNGMNYGSLLLKGEGIDSTYDPDVKVNPLLVAGYWPGGIDTDGHKYLAHSVNDHNELNMHDEQHFIRNLLSRAVVDPAALERHRQRTNEQMQLIQQANALGVAAVQAACILKQTPFSYVMISKVMESQQIEAGQRVAALYYPLGLSPEVSLDAIRGQVEQTIAEEAI